MSQRAVERTKMPDRYHSSEEEREEEGSKDDNKGPKTTKPIKTTASRAGGCDTVSTATTTPEVASKKKPRGRPKGSKNKPKPPTVIARENNDNVNESSMRPMVLEVSAGADVVDTLTHFARRRHVSLCILSGSGAVANVTLRHYSSHQKATLTFPGRFHILSFSGILLSPSSSLASSLSSCGPLNISLAGVQGQVIGGTVAGKLVAVSTVVLLAASVVNPSFHRLTSVHELQEGDHHHQDQDQTDHHHHHYQDVKPNNKANITRSSTGYVGISSSDDHQVSNIHGGSSLVATTSTSDSAPLIMPLSCQNIHNLSGSAIERRVLPWPPPSSSSRPPHHDPY